MNYRLINLENWERKEVFNHYTKSVPCTYSLTVDLDISVLSGHKLYPAMLWSLSAVVNEMEEFRTAVMPDGVGIFDFMHPSYTVLNPETKRFCSIWSPFQWDKKEFMKHCQDDITHFKKAEAFLPCPNMPLNVFNVSMIPWVRYTAFHLDIRSCGGEYLLPIFTIGKFSEKDGRRMLPLALQVHHAVCDGYHVGVFVEKLQKKISSFSTIVQHAERS